MALVACFLSSSFSSSFSTGLYKKKTRHTHLLHGPAPVAMATAASSPSHQLVEGVFTPRPHQLRGGFLFVCHEVLFYFTLHFSVHSTVLRPPGGDDVVVFLAQTHATQASTLNAAVAAPTAAASVCVCAASSLLPFRQKAEPPLPPSGASCPLLADFGNFALPPPLSSFFLLNHPYPPFVTSLFFFPTSPLVLPPPWQVTLPLPRRPSRHPWQTVGSQSSTGPPTARRMAARMATRTTTRPTGRTATTVPPPPPPWQQVSACVCFSVLLLK